LNAEFYRFIRFDQRVRGNVTVWADQALDGGYTIDLVPAAAPSGYQDPENYFEGEVKVASSGTVVGTFTMGWVNSFIRKITLEIGTMEGLPIPEKDDTGTRTWTSIFSEVGWDINVVVGNTSIPEPADSDGLLNDEQQHELMLASRTPTDLDKEWKYYLLVIKKMEGVERGAVIDTGRTWNEAPREGSCLTTDWVYGTLWDGSEDTFTRWPESVKGKKFIELNDPWFRTAVHEVGHLFNLAHPHRIGFENQIMTDTPSFVVAGEDGSTPQPFPENITPETFSFVPYDVLLLQHRPDIHVRPGYVDFGFAAQVCVPLVLQETIY
jgi:hypothetical protein